LRGFALAWGAYTRRRRLLGAKTLCGHDRTRRIAAWRKVDAGHRHQDGSQGGNTAAHPQHLVLDAATAFFVRSCVRSLRKSPIGTPDGLHLKSVHG